MSSARHDLRRPEPALPPTLLPHAIAQAAPPRARRISFLASCLIYSAAAGGFSLISSQPHLLAGLSTTTEKVFDPKNVIQVIPVRPEDPPPAPPPPPAGSSLKVEGTRPPDWVPPTAQVEVPETTPAELNRVDHSRDSLYTSEMRVGDGKLEIQGTGDRIGTTPNGVSGAAPGAVFDVAFENVKIRHQVSPQYPSICRAIRMQGTVELLLTVDVAGVPRDVQVISSPHIGLTASAVEAAKQWRFEPAMVGSSPVTSRFRLTLKFSLKG